MLLLNRMKHFVRYIVATLFFAFIISPAVAAAQTTSTSFNVASSSHSRFYQFYNESSGVSTSTRQQQIQGYRQQSNDFQQKISALGSTANASVLMPVLFGVGVKDISSNFGDPRSSDRTHEGEDIMAVKGTPIVSPTPAVVLRTGVGDTEGNYVYTANPGGETFIYMHLDRIGEGLVSGLVLKQGSLIGYVGNTGNASGGPAHLHFEIHNSSGTPVDPFPRLTGELSLQEKISDLSIILTQTSDSTALSRFLVTNFRGTFIAALAANITLPMPIIDALASIPATTASTNTEESLPTGDLDIDSSGDAVIALQKYLIQAASGVAATRLVNAGATGYFGIITKATLVEYQVAVGISPTSGYYGPITRAFITAHPIGTSQSTNSGNSTASSTATIIRDLYQSISGEDVRTLQQLLNDNGYTVASTGSGSPENETTYFGPATESAVIKFQIAHGISPAVGYVGPLTRAALASL